MLKRKKKLNKWEKKKNGKPPVSKYAKKVQKRNLDPESKTDAEKVDLIVTVIEKAISYKKLYMDK